MKEQSVERVVLPWGMSLDNPEIVFGTPDPEKGPDSFLTATVKVDYVRPNKNVTFANYSLSIDDGEHGEHFSNGTLTGKKQDGTLHFDQQLEHERAENLLESDAKQKIEGYGNTVRMNQANRKHHLKNAKIAGGIMLSSAAIIIGNIVESKLTGTSVLSDSDGVLYMLAGTTCFAAGTVSLTQYLESTDAKKFEEEFTNKRDRLVRFVRGIEKFGLVRLHEVQDVETYKS